MNLFKKSALYWNTLKYVRYSQIIYRLYYHVRPKPQHKSFSCELFELNGAWIHTKNNCFTQLKDKESISLLGIKGIANKWMPEDKDKLWIYHLHYFDYAADHLPNIDNSRIQKLITSWITGNKMGEGPGWEAYPLSLRIVNWIKFSLNGNIISEEIIESLGLQAWYLNKNIEYHLMGNHLFRNAKALFFAGSFLNTEYSQNWLTKGAEIIKKELEEQVLNDGGNFELSPMYHCNMLQDILDLINLQNRYPSEQLTDLLEKLHHKASSMLRWLSFMTHPDGEVAFFNDAAFKMSLNLSELRKYAQELGIEDQIEDSGTTIHLKDSGYGIVSLNKFKLICDIGEIGPSYMPGHGHSDVLSFELSVNDKRVFVNSGTSLYGLTKERLEQRKTKAHNTVEVDYLDSSEVWSGFRVAKRANPNNIHVEENCIKASHSGYQRLKGDVIHSREWKVYDRKLEIKDNISGKFDVAIAYYHLHPQIGIVKKGPDTYELSHDDGGCYEFRILGGKSKLISSFWYPEFGLSIPNKTFHIEIEDREAVCYLEIL